MALRAVDAGFDASNVLTMRMSLTGERFLNASFVNQIISYRICRRAQLPERGWHTLRHTFGTHAALFGVSTARPATGLDPVFGHQLRGRYGVQDGEAEARS
jgi:hypothetical protein